MLNLIFKGTEKSGLAIDKGLADVVNEGLRTVGQSEEVQSCGRNLSDHPT